MSTIQLEAASDHVRQLAYESQPVKAVLELIWNGLDADAHHVNVTLQRDDMEAVIGVVVEDDGHGIKPEECARDFGRIGGSWKPLARRSQGEGRPLHGASGQGRLRAFALGAQVRWITAADNTAGQRMQSVISASYTDRSTFDLSDPLPTSEPTGTRFEASGKQSSYLNQLSAEVVPATIAAALAPYLIAHQDVAVTFDGIPVRPQDNIDNEAEYELSFEHGGAPHAASMRIIEWRDGKERSLHLCDGAGVPVDELPMSIASDFTYSAYVMWPPMAEHRHEWLLGDSDETLVGALLAAARGQLDDHFEARRAAQRRKLVVEWKEKQTYPYEGDATSDVDKAERAAFDVVATAIRRHIPREARKQKLTLGLLRDSLQHRPGELTRALDEILGLPNDEREQLDRLLERTSLSRVIRASASVTDRLDFIAALEHLVFDPEASKLTREREHLHRMLERELWVFGEQYNMMISERSLTAVLDRHLHILGRTRDNKTAVRKLDGKVGRVDLLLSAAATEHDRNRHLVIELKAPDIVATWAELKQIKDYAKAVYQDARFANTAAVWDFWLVTAEMDDDVQQETSQRHRPRGLVHEPDLPDRRDTSVRVWVRTWNEIIEDAKHRLSYFRNGLDHDPSLEHALDYLRRQHGDVIPLDLLSGSEGA
ncbi:ATP-binding protein [Amycolatopsis eburnea]|uniref:Histidine kinase n=1 Tax=Amycolatopsis eburnea TaxID=2267691 RepID=A0A3R9FLR4_9PSEU|nr:ATP-binding protein [Amycolatopsis eburnea]RSD16297.1 histidine kinase [Amycolatopsis eburnea]